MEDNWTPYQFDGAVMMFGIFIENKLHETDDHGREIYTLAGLLEGSDIRREKNMRKFASKVARGGIEVRQIDNRPKTQEE